MAIASFISLPRLCLLTLLAVGVGVAQDFSQPDKEPAPQAAQVEKANQALAAGDLQTALTLLSDLNRNMPHSAPVLYDLGTTLEAMAAAGAPPPAGEHSPKDYYREAIVADPTYAEPRVALGLLLARSGEAELAHTELAAAVSLPGIAPELKASALRALARLDEEAKPPRQAAASSELLDALKLTPEQPGDILLGAEIAESAGDQTAAEQAYRRYLATPEGKDTVEATAALAHLLLARNQPAEAEALLAPALAAHPGDPTLTAQLASAYATSGDPARAAKAIALIEPLHRDRPRDAALSRVLARIYLETGHAEDAEALYAQLIAADGAHLDPTLLDARAEALLYLHRPAEAEKMERQATADRSGFPNAQAFGDAALRLAFAAGEIDDPRTTLQALALRATVLAPSPSSLYLEATANDALHQNTQAADLYRKFLASAGGQFPNQESQARARLQQLPRTR